MFPYYELFFAVASYVLLLGFVHFSRRAPKLFTSQSRGAVIAFYIGSTTFVVTGALGLAHLQGLENAFVFYGGLLGFFVFAFAYCAIQRLSFIEVLNRVAAPLALAHAVGRVGCFLEGCCHGTHCDLPWAVHNDFVHDRVHPVQLYEALALALLGFLLWRNEGRRIKGAAIRPTIGIYLTAYAVLRFVLEFFRGDSTRGEWGALSTSQWISLPLALVGVIILVRAKRNTPEHLRPNSP